jgi:hypothetical protein
VEIANAVEAVQDGRVYIELVNGPFFAAGGTPDQYRAALACAIGLGWLSRHESGTYVKFTPAGAELFALIGFRPLRLLIETKVEGIILKIDLIFLLRRIHRN